MLLDQHELQFKHPHFSLQPLDLGPLRVEQTPLLPSLCDERHRLAELTLVAGQLVRHDHAGVDAVG